MTIRRDPWYLVTAVVMALAIAASLPVSRLARIVWLVAAVGAISLIARALHLARRRREEANQELLDQAKRGIGHDVRNAIMPVLEAAATCPDPELRADAERAIQRVIAAPESMTLDRLHPLQSHPNPQDPR